LTPESHEDGEEVHCCDSLTMIDQKCHPPLSRFWTSRHFSHPAQHTSLRDVVTEHFQLSMDAWRAPGRVLLNHSEDRLPQFPAHRSSSHTWPMPREPFLVQLETRGQPMTVLGWTRIKARRHSCHSTQNNLLGVENRGRELWRSSTASRCLKERFSKRRPRQELTDRRNRSN
jgi:hypothetical protein